MEGDEKEVRLPICSLSVRKGIMKDNLIDKGTINFNTKKNFFFFVYMNSFNFY